MTRTALRFSLLLLLLMLIAPFATADDQANWHVLMSAKKSHRLSHFELSSQDIPKIKTGNWSVRLTTLHGGKQEGVQLVTIDNGKLTIRVIPTRGMSVLDVQQGETRFGWKSPVKEVVHPQFINLDSRGGLGWLEGFNELMVRCGLEFAGHPGLDEFIDNTGAKAEMTLTLHGKIGNIPASEVEVSIDRRPPHRIRVRGIVHERSFFGPKLELRSELSTVPGSDSFTIRDTIVNKGAGPQEIQLLYHTNYGSPLLEQGATVLAPLKEVAPMNAHAAKAIHEYQTYREPTAGFIEEVYVMHPLADEQGQTHALLKNQAGDLAASITWSVKELPFLTVWKNTTAIEDGYVTGLEPGIGFPYNRKVERQFGRVPKLQPGEKREFSLEFGFHVGEETVEKMASQIEAIQANRKVVISREPPVVPE